MSILDDAEYDREKFCLGKLCKRGHDWNGTGQSLRHSRSSGCVACLKGRVRDKEVVRAQQKQWRERNKEKIRLRCCDYRSRNRDRLREVNRAYRDAHKAELSAKGKRFREENKESIQVQRADYREQNRSKINQIGRDRYAANPEKDRLAAAAYSRQNYELARPRKKAYEQKWMQTERGRTLKRLTGHRRRARLKSIYSQPPTVEEISALRQNCNHQCVYCGGNTDLALDHFISIHAGGTDCIGNLAIACKSCNSSKGTKDPYQWFQSRPTFSQKRWKIILKLLGKTQSNYNQIPLL